MSAIAANLDAVRERVGAACLQARRDPAGVELVAVSKYAAPEAIRAAAATGQRAFGENRMQDALEKVEALADVPGIQWHLIGHLQTNKARHASGPFALIQSVDSVRLADAISRRAEWTSRPQPILLQVNVAADAAKYGFTEESVLSDYPLVAALGGVEVAGLMTIGPLVPDPELSRPHFRRLRELAGRLDGLGVAPPLRQLSMGMSADFEVAIEEGATIVRVGEAIFGGRER
ncbi:MAG TPA: YggS family pyridoxal phosphate-dependent enzyme [Candidatus Dormibacteraeota bacterium]|nr:YggS family pyridoxal phosphate-dependent enzyme [Candidatus Dormibacteraeota bacterium]